MNAANPWDFICPNAFAGVFAPDAPNDKAAYIARRRDTIAAELGREDRQVQFALGDAIYSKALIAAIRVGEEAEIGRLMLAGARQALRDKAESLAEHEWMERNP